MRSERLWKAGSAALLFLMGIAIGYLWRGDRPEAPIAPNTDRHSVNLTLSNQSTAKGSAGSGSSLDQRPTGVSFDEPFLSRAARTMTIGSDFRREREFLKLLDGMKPEDAVAVRALLAKTLDQGVLYESLWEAFWTRWGEIDGPAAMEYILTTQTHGAVPKDIRRVMRGWGATDPKAAAAWAEAHQDEHLRDELVGLADGYASENLAGATTMVLEAAPPGDPNLGSLMEVLAEQAVRQGRVAGLTGWFDQLPPGTSDGPRAKALGHVYWRLYSADIDRAKDWVREQSSKPWRSDKIVGEMAKRVAEGDPASAAAWLQSVPASPSDGTYPGIDGVVRSWLAKDPAATRQWLEGLDDGEFKTQASRAFIDATTVRSVTVRKDL